MADTIISVTVIALTLLVLTAAAKAVGFQL